MLYFSTCIYYYLWVVTEVIFTFMNQLFHKSGINTLFIEQKRDHVINGNAEEVRRKTSNKYMYYSGLASSISIYSALDLESKLFCSKRNESDSRKWITLSNTRQLNDSWYIGAAICHVLMSSFLIIWKNNVTWGYL